MFDGAVFRKVISEATWCCCITIVDIILGGGALKVDINL